MKEDEKEEAKDFTGFIVDGSQNDNYMPLKSNSKSKEGELPPIKP